MKNYLKMLFVLAVLAVYTSCNSNTQKTNEPENVNSTKMDTQASSNPTTASATVTQNQLPLTAVEIIHTVKNYEVWKPLFDADSTNREAAGLETITIGRELDNPNNILVVLKVSDMQKADGFMKNPKLKVVMDKAGVVSKPVSQYWNVIRNNPDSHPKEWFEVTHKVKDFAAWVKVYDEEGKEKRSADGMVDDVMARSVTDSNLIKLVFDITDIKKAKAAIYSPEKKKLMQSAGVIGVPEIKFYKKGE